MNLLFLTTANLSSNPRLVKELRIALSRNYKVTVLLFDLRQWTSELEIQYSIEFKQVKLIYLPIIRSDFFSWLTSSSLHFLSKKIYGSLNSYLQIAAFASNKRSFLLHRRLNKLNRDKFDLVISHNLGALYPAYQYAKQQQIPFGFDVEDFHPGETIHADKENEIGRRIFLMQKILPKAAFVTAASPLIAQEVEKLCKVPVVTINNSFYSNEFSLPLSDNNLDGKLKLVWFSQNINHGRGLELLLPALDPFSDNVTLTLIGNINSNFAKLWVQHRDYIKIVAPLKQDMLHKEISKHDVGLAMELRSVDFNREIAITNKIFAYKQAGLYVLATDTKAQVEFMEQFEGDGYVCEQNIESLKNGIASVLDNIETIRAKKSLRFEQAKGIAFETEAEKLVALWQKATHT